MSLSDLPKLLRTSVKPVHKRYPCTGFKEVLNNFGGSDDEMILWKKCLFPLDAYVVSCPTCAKNLKWYLILILQLITFLFWVLIIKITFVIQYDKPFCRLVSIENSSLKYEPWLHLTTINNRYATCSEKREQMFFSQH